MPNYDENGFAIVDERRKVWDSHKPETSPENRELPTTFEELDKMLDIERENGYESGAESADERGGYDSGYDDGSESGAEDEYCRFLDCIKPVYTKWKKKAKGNVLAGDREEMASELWRLVEDLSVGNLP